MLRLFESSSDALRPFLVLLSDHESVGLKSGFPIGYPFADRISTGIADRCQFVNFVAF